MKRIFCLACVFLIFCGCKAKNVKPVTENIEFVARFKCDNTEYACKCFAGTNGNFTAKFSEPQTVKDLEYIYTENDFSVKFKGLTYKAANKSAAYLGVTDRISKVFSDAAKNQAQKIGEEYIIKSKPLGEKYEMYFSGGGLPLKIKLSDIEILILEIKQR